MGTRHLIAVQADGQYKIANYGQWDGYPSGQGVKVLQFLRENDLTVFRAKLAQCRFIETDETAELYEKVIGRKPDGWVNMEESAKMKKAYPSLHRDTGAGVLSVVMSSREDVPLHDNIDFAGQSLFCEFAYVIDLDKGSFEVYRGLNKAKIDPTERFANAPTDGEYQPVQLWREWELTKLPTEAEFLEALKDDDESEAA